MCKEYEPIQFESSVPQYSDINYLPLRHDLPTYYFYSHIQKSQMPSMFYFTAVLVFRCNSISRGVEMINFQSRALLQSDKRSEGVAQFANFERAISKIPVHPHKSHKTCIYQTLQCTIVSLSSKNPVDSTLHIFTPFFWGGKA